MLDKINNRGFSYIEISAAIAIFLVIVVLTSTYVVQGFRASVFNMEQEEAIENARRAMEMMTKNIRGANNSEKGSYPLSVIDDENFTYYSDTDDDDIMEKVEYRLIGLELQQVITEPGTENNYDGASTTVILSNYVNNVEDPIFEYYDADYNETTVINEIRLIKIKLEINVTPERAPDNYDLESDVNLRNLKDNL